MAISAGTAIWGCATASFLSEKVLGIRPAAPGFTQVRIEPEPAGLKRLEGSHPTPFGEIELSLRVIGNKVRKTVKLPPEIRELS